MYYLFNMRQVICLFVYIGNVYLHWKKSPVYGVLDSNLHTRLAIVTENELGLAFPLGTFPPKFEFFGGRFLGGKQAQVRFRLRSLAGCGGYCPKRRKQRR